MLGPAFAAGLLLSLGQLQWDAGLRAEGRALRDTAGDLQLDPLLAMESSTRDTALRGRYEPQVIFRAPSSRGTIDVLNRAAFTAALRLDPDTWVTAAQTASVGSTDFSWLALAPSSPPPINVQGTTGSTTAVLDESSSVTLVERISNRLSASVTGGFSVSGALHERDLSSLPRTQAAQLAVASTWKEYQETFTVGANGSYGWVSNGYTTDVFGASAAWRHAFSAASQRGLGAGVVDRRDPALGPLYEAELRGGVAVVGGSYPAQRRQVVPTATLALLREAPPGRGSLGARVTLRYAPEIDPTNGAYRQRGELSSSLDLRLERDLVAFAAAGVGVTPDPLPTYPRMLAQGELGLTYEVMRGFAVSAGVRIAHVPATEWAGVVTTTFLQHGRF
jgi:hypothetical protein